MVNFEGISYLAIVPILVVGGSWLAARVLGFSFWITCLAVGIASALSTLPLPLAEDLVRARPWLPLLASWVVLLAIGVGLALARWIERVANPRDGFLRLVMLAALASAALAATAVVVSPESVSATVGRWKGAAGAVLFSIAALALTVSLMRSLRAAAALVWWFAVTIVLGCEVFLGSLPRDVLRSQVVGAEPSEVVSSSRAALEAFRDQLEKALGGSAAGALVVDLVSTSDNALHPRFQEFLRRELVRVGVSEKALTVAASSGVTLPELEPYLTERISKARPGVMLLVVGSRERNLRGNSYAIPDLGEFAARDFVEDRRWLNSIPVVAMVRESALVRFVSAMISGDESISPLAEQPLRVSPEEVDGTIARLGELARAAGSKIILISDPTYAGSTSSDTFLGEQARAAMRPQLAADFSASPLGGDFIAPEVLSEAGLRRYAAMIADKVRSAVELPAIQPLVSSPSERVFTQRELRSEIFVTLAVPEAQRNYFSVVGAINGRFLDDKRLSGAQPVTVRFAVPPEIVSQAPAFRLGFYTRANPPENEDRIGTSDFFITYPVSVHASERVLDIRIAGIVAAGGEMQGLIAAEIDPRSGLAVRVFRGQSAPADMVGLRQFVRSAPWGATVVVAWNVALPPDEIQDLQAALRYVGLNEGDFSRPFGIGIGGAGGGAGKGDLTLSEQPISVERGGERVQRLARYHLISIDRSPPPNLLGGSQRPEESGRAQ